MKATLRLFAGLMCTSACIGLPDRYGIGASHGWGSADHTLKDSSFDMEDTRAEVTLYGDIGNQESRVLRRDFARDAGQADMLARIRELEAQKKLNAAPVSNPTGGGSGDSIPWELITALLFGGAAVGKGTEIGVRKIRARSTGNGSSCE